MQRHIDRIRDSRDGSHVRSWIWLMGKLKTMLIEMKEDQNEDSIRSALQIKAEPKKTPKGHVAQAEDHKGSTATAAAAATPKPKRPRQNQAQRVTPKEMVQEDRSRSQRRIQKGRVKAMAKPKPLQNQKQRQSLIPAYLVFFGQKELAIGGIHALSFMTPSTKPLQRKLLLLQTQRVARVHHVPPQQKPLLQLLSLRRCQVRLHRFRMLVQSAHGRLPSMMSPHRIPTCHLLVDLCRQLSGQSKPCSRSLLLLGH